MNKYHNQFEFNRDFKVVSEIRGQLVGQLVNYPKVTAKGSDIHELECNLKVELTVYLIKNELIDFETLKPKVFL